MAAIKNNKEHGLRLLIAADASGMSNAAFRILFGLQARLVETGACDESVEEMADRLGCDSRSIRRALAELRSKGWLQEAELHGRQPATRKIQIAPKAPAEGER